MKKKWIFLLSFVIVFLVTYILFGYVPIFGKVLSYFIATNHIECEKIEKIKYDFLNGNYNVYTEKEEIQIDLSKGIVHNNNFENSQMVMEKYKKTKKNIESEQGVNLPEKCEVYSVYDMWDNRKVYHKLYVLGICGEEEVNPQESIYKPARIATELIKQMEINSIQLSYFDVNGYYEISIPFNKKEKISYEELLRNTVKLSEEDLPEEYKTWKEQASK